MAELKFIQEFAVLIALPTRCCLEHTMNSV